MMPRARSDSSKEDSIRLAGPELRDQRHICGFFSDLEEYRVSLPFIKEGIGRGEKASHVVNPKLRNEHLKQLDSFGVDLFRRDIILDMLHSHPMIIIGGILQKTPFFISPGPFSRELRERRDSIHKDPAVAN